jgi:two-component system CheB/CheR fusion protein
MRYISYNGSKHNYILKEKGDLRLNEEQEDQVFNSPYHLSTNTVTVAGIVVSPAKREEFLQFLEHIPPTSGIAFLVMQHDTDKELMQHTDQIAAYTSLNVFYAQNNMELIPNCIYLLPYQKEVSIREGLLLFSNSTPLSDPNMPIDSFMYTLAENFGCKTICLLFSDVGTDGVQGIHTINQMDGLVLIEGIGAHGVHLTPTELSTDRMDYMVSPQEISRLLLEYMTFYNKNDKGFKEELSHLFSIVKQATGVDFSHYKHASIVRRIQRRMGMKSFHLLYDYNQFLYNNPNEITDLQKDLLIGVTYFFRDPDAFAIFEKKVLPAIFESRSKERQIRIWVAGCSTGEEVYSLAILFKQYMQKNDPDFDLKIFATDLDKDSIQYANRGIYPETIAKNVSPDLLDNYFVNQGKTYQINKEIRQMIVFAQHNLLKDPPFIQLDLVTCRNLLIYIQPDMQKKIISLLHFALRPEAYLFLGPSETLGKLSNLFKPIDTKWNIYQYKKNNYWLSTGSFGINESLNYKKMNYTSKVIAKLKETELLIKLDNIYTKLIEEYISPCIIVNEHNEIIHINGNANIYLIIPTGKPSHSLFKMIPDYLSIAIGTALHKVRTDQQEVVYRNIRINHDLTPHSINLIIKPFNMNSANDKLTIIFFEKYEAASNASPYIDDQADLQVYNLESNASQHIKDLEHQLFHAQESLQATIEELETSNEEFQASNEELIVSNEELQSTNEELQSVNEELMAVNNEYQLKIHELSELNNDMSNFFVSTDIATIFLDSHMNIRKFTPAATKEINLMESDIGRPIGDISHHFEYDQLLLDAQKTLLTATTIEKGIQSKHGKWFNIRISPYLTVNHFIDGVVITFIDITELKKVNDELTVLAYAIEQSPGSIVITDIERNIEYVNTKYTEQTGYTLDEVIHSQLKLYSDQLTSEQLMDIWTDVSSGKKWLGELQNKHRDGVSFYEMVSLLPITNHQGKITHLLKISENMMEQKHTMELLHKSEMLSVIGQLAAGVAHEIRNPLTALKGFTKLLEPDTMKKHYIQIMTSELERIETIISELLILAKPHKLHFEKRNILPILQDVIMLLEPQAILNNVEIVTKFAPFIPLVNCIEHQLKQVFINIIKNAIEAMPHGGNLIVKTKLLEDNHVLISFNDQGVGIPDNKIPKLGDPFYTTKENGTGLGLMISYKIIQDHKGKITITSTLGRGSNVDITLKTIKEA